MAGNEAREEDSLDLGEEELSVLGAGVGSGESGPQPPPEPTEKENTIAAIEAELERMEAIRVFEVTLKNRRREIVTGHFLENANVQGHLNIFTIDSEGNQMITQAYAFGEWTKFHEINQATPGEPLVKLPRRKKRMAIVRNTVRKVRKARKPRKSTGRPVGRPRKVR